MKIKFSLFAVLALVVTAPFAHAQCSRSGSELLVDNYFANGCSNWVFTLGAGSSSNTNMCANGPTFALFIHRSDGNSAEATQNTIADQNGSNFSFGYTAQFVGQDGSHSAAVYFDVIDLDTNNMTFVDSIGPTATPQCHSNVSVSLGSHPEWVGHHLQVLISTDIAANGGGIWVTGVSLQQTN